jgi:DNA-binding protein H-NS
MANKYRDMTLKALLKEQELIAEAIKEKQAAERASFKAEMEEKAAMLGLSLGELFGGRSTKGVRTPAKVKYRNPKDPSQTWSGRGRMAGWLARETGGDKKKLDKFLVD